MVSDLNSEIEIVQSQLQQQSSPASIFLQAKYGIGTFIGAEMVFAHFGPTGIFAGFVAGWLASQCGPELHASIAAKYAGLDPRTKQAVNDALGKIQEMRGISRPTQSDTALSVEQEPTQQNVLAQRFGTPARNVRIDVAAANNPTEDDAEPEQEDVDPATHMNFGPTLRPHANKIFSGRKVLFGVSDAGKSNNVAVVIEEIARFKAPLFLFDTEGEYRSLVDKKYLPNGIYVTRDKIPPERAYDFAQWCLKNMKQVVFDLSTYSDSEAAWLMINVIKGVKDFEESNDVRLPCEIILDEASVWLPQNAKQSTLYKVMIDDPDGESVDDEGKPKPITLLALLERCFFSIVVRRGRKRGMGFTLATQRIAELNKSAMSASWMILMKQTQPADFRAYNEFGLSAEDAMSLQQGEAFILAPGKVLERHQFRLRRSPHGASTPGLAELRQHQRKNRREDVDVDSFLATAEEIDTDDSRYSEVYWEAPTYGPERHPERDLRAAGGNLPPPPPPPAQPLSAPVERVEVTPEVFIPGENDLQLTEVQARLLEVWYQECRNIDNSLAQIRNDKGQGLGGRYFRHASWILEQRGLKKKKG